MSIFHKQLGLGTRVPVPHPLGEGLRCLLPEEIGLQSLPGVCGTPPSASRAHHALSPRQSVQLHPPHPSAACQTGASSECGQRRARWLWKAGRASCWEVDSMAMLWALWPKWLAGKGLPLLGVVLLQKREKKGPQWSHWRVKYLIFPGKRGPERSSECSPL